MNLTKEELNLIVSLIDAGIKGTGVQVFQAKGGLIMHSALEKLYANVETQDEAVEE